MIKITGHTQVFAILADPIEHVKTPQGINHLLDINRLDGVMVPLHVTPEGLPDIVQGLRQIKNLGGFVVTVPHKTAMLRLCDELTPAASMIGAVNVVRRSCDGRLTGGMLDGEGFATGLYKAGIELKGKSVYLAGAGGAARAIAFALANANVAQLTISNRTSSKAAALIGCIASHFPGLSMTVGTDDPSGHDLIVNGTSLGLRPNDALPLNVSQLTSRQIVAEIIMQPAKTPLLLAASQKGCQIHFGAPMLACQIELMAAFMGASIHTGA